MIDERTLHGEYHRMASDPNREQQALEWSEVLLGDVADQL